MTAEEQRAVRHPPRPVGRFSWDSWTSSYDETVFPKPRTKRVSVASTVVDELIERLRSNELTWEQYDRLCEAAASRVKR